MNYKQKYFKYKQKYLNTKNYNLNNIKGGVFPIVKHIITGKYILNKWFSNLPDKSDKSNIYYLVNKTDNDKIISCSLKKQPIYGSTKSNYNLLSDNFKDLNDNILDTHNNFLEILNLEKYYNLYNFTTKNDLKKSMEKELINFNKIDDKDLNPNPNLPYFYYFITNQGEIFYGKLDNNNDNKKENLENLENLEKYYNIIIFPDTFIKFKIKLKLSVTTVYEKKFRENYIF